MAKMLEWIPSRPYPEPGDIIPPERCAVLVWLRDEYLPFCGYIRHYSDGPFWVVYHGNTDIGTDVVAWCDCLPQEAPDGFNAGLYARGQKHKRRKLRYKYPKHVVECRLAQGMPVEDLS